MRTFSMSSQTRPCETVITINMEKAFLRHPRPQDPSLPVPTKAALLARSSIGKPLPLSKLSQSVVGETSKSNAGSVLASQDEHSDRITTRESFPSKELEKLGSLTQGTEQWIICSNKQRQFVLSMVMFKKTSRVTGQQELKVLKQLSHPGIAQLKYAFIEKESMYIGISYCRYTLMELLHVHLKFREPHIQWLAASVLLPYV